MTGPPQQFKLDSVGVWGVKWDRGDTEPPGDFTFFYRNRIVNYELRTGFLIHERIISAVKRVGFVIGRHI
jgi:hypothetical protein